MSKHIILVVILLVYSITNIFAQVDPKVSTTKNEELNPNAQNTNIEVDSVAPKKLSKFAQFNKKAEALFKVLPFPMVSYSTETGTVFGLAKYNLVNLVKGDTISSASSFSELVSISTEGQFKIVLGSSLYLDQNKLLLQGGIQYVEYPEYIFGIGNEVYRENAERIKTKRIVFTNKVLYALNKSKNLYGGITQEYKNYLNVESISDDLGRQPFLDSTEYAGYNGGITSGFGLTAIFDKRDHKYNTRNGVYTSTSFMFFEDYLGSDFSYTSFELDFRAFYNPWLKHVIGIQLYTQQNVGEVPFYSLGQIGGTNRMRGYYLGAIRDKVIADSQIEYRMPIWSILGVTAFASAGRVAENYSDMSLDGLWYAGGFGLRIMVDSANRANLRIDFGYGQQNSKTIVVGFTEAF